MKSLAQQTVILVIMKKKIIDKTLKIPSVSVRFHVKWKNMSAYFCTVDGNNFNYREKL